MPAITIFCHGTNSFSDEVSLPASAVDEGELVELIEKNYVMGEPGSLVPGDEAADRTARSALQEQSFNGGKLLLHGVGSRGHDPHQTRMRKTEGQLQGYRFHHLPAWAAHVSNLVSNYSVDRVVEFGDTIGGVGVGSNVHKAITFLKAMQREGVAPDSITMVGWSRGAVTCVRLAQELNKEMGDIPVHIFAGDPVPGFGRHESWDNLAHGDKSYAITANVKTFLHIIAMDVTGLAGFKAKGFRPLLPRGTGGSEQTIAMVPMPGNHSQVVKTAMGSPGRLTMDLAIRFMEVHDASYLKREFVEAYKLGMEQIRDHYDTVMIDVACGGQYPISHQFQQGSGDGRPGEFAHLTGYTGSGFGTGFRSKSYVNYHHRFIANRLGDPNAFHGEDNEGEHGFHQLLSRMYS